MDGMKYILQLRGVRPFFSDKFDITKHKNYRFLSDSDDKNTFDIGRHVNRKLKVKPNEMYEFHEIVITEDELPDELYNDYGIAN